MNELLNKTMKLEIKEQSSDELCDFGCNALGAYIDKWPALDTEAFYEYVIQNNKAGRDSGELQDIAMVEIERLAKDYVRSNESVRILVQDKVSKPGDELVREGVVSAKSKYVDGDKMPREIFNVLVDLDPTPQKKYIDWMARVYVSGQRDVDKFGIIKDFDELVSRNKIRGEQSDINKYKDTEAVYDVVKHFETVPSKSELKKKIKSKDAEKVFDNDKVSVYLVKSKQASCLYGSGTKWCTAASSSHNYFNQYFYGEKVNLYYVISKNPIGKNTDKIAVAVYTNGNLEVYDAADKLLPKEVYIKLFNELGVPLQ